MIDSVLTWGISRVITVGACAVSSFLVPHHDLSHNLLSDKSKLLFLVRWDAIFFYRIAKDGYITDNMTAFFPLYPMLIRMLLYCGIPVVAGGAILSNLSFLLSAVLIYRVTKKYTDAHTAQKTCFLFCFSPCSILYSALYTESIFTMLVLLGIASSLSQSAWSVLWISLASAVRSNGFILAPIVFIGLVGKYPLYLSALLSLCPLAVFSGIQAYWWINRFPTISVLPYSYVQAKYWEQGFLEFYRYSKNIPNFLVGAPFVCLSLCILQNYFTRENKTLLILCRNTRAAVIERLHTALQIAYGYASIYTKSDQFTKKSEKSDKSKSIEFTGISEKEKDSIRVDRLARKKEYSLNISMRYYLIRLFLQGILLFQVVLSVFFIHMNMHFRFVAYNPVVYWELSEIFERKGIERRLMFCYVCFSFVYAVLYGAYFPPA